MPYRCPICLKHRCDHSQREQEEFLRGEIPLTKRIGDPLKHLEPKL